MTLLTTATLIGVDRHVDFDALDALSTDFPIAEWGAVYAGRLVGANSTMAVELDWLWRLAASAQARRWRFALIAEGVGIDELLQASHAQDWEPGVFRVALCADRVHLRGSPDPSRCAELAALERRLRETDFPVEITVPFCEAGNQHVQYGAVTQQDSTSADGVGPTPSFCSLQGQRVGFNVDPFAKDFRQALQRAAQQAKSSQLRVQVDVSLLRTSGRFDLRRCAEALANLTEQGDLL